MKNLFFIFLLLFNFEVLHSKNKITNIPATSDILPNDGIYKLIIITISILE